MSKHDNFQVNFSLKGFTSIQIGIYFLLLAYAIKNILNGFLVDDNPIGMLSAEILEILIISLVFFTFLFSSFALFFKGRRLAKKHHYKLWNGKTKTAFWKYLIGFLATFITLILVMKQGYIDLLTPVFLTLYAILLLFFKAKKNKNIYILIGVSLLLACYCYVIPTYWYASIFILGISHFTYGIINKN